MRRVLIGLMLTLWSTLLWGQHILISEVFIESSVNDTAEFVEITNKSGSTVSLDNYYLSDDNEYYLIVNGAVSTSSSDFVFQFPAGTTIDNDQNLVIAVTATSFYQVFGKQPDFEIFNTDPGVPEMIMRSTGTSPKPLFANARELLVLFTWDGVSDLVQDVDYVTWGVEFSSARMDKSGVSIDGPDADTDPSTYLDDTPIGSQRSITETLIVDKSYARMDVVENQEITSGGNGVSGHDETSEWLDVSFVELNNPTPGEFGEGSAFSGSGIATVSPVSVEQGNVSDLTITLVGEFSDALTRMGVYLPSTFTWSKNTNDVSLSGNGLASASSTMSGDTLVVENAAITKNDTAIITITNITMPAQLGVDTVYVFTAVAGEALVPIKAQPVVQVTEAPVSIADIQQNTSNYLNREVRVRGWVVIGAGTLANDRTSAYIADESGAGINIYKSGSVDANLVRGNYVEIVGTVYDYFRPGESIPTTEIINYSVTVLAENQKLPDPLELTTSAARNVDLEGYWVQVEGVINDLASGIGGGTNITLNDGSGDVTVRVWDATGINLDFFDVGDTVIVQGPVGIFSGATQLLPGYQEDIRFKNQNFSLADGSGKVTLNFTSIEKDSSNLTLELSVAGTVPDTIASLIIYLPVYWDWDTTDVATAVQLEGSGFENAQVTVSVLPYEPAAWITITSAQITLTDSGKIHIHHLTSPDKDILSTIFVKTAGKEGALSFIKNTPQIRVGSADIVPIRDIQMNSTLFTDKDYTVRGEVTIGAGVLRTDRTSAYMQDSSGYGININSQQSYSNLERGFVVQISGSISEYQGTTQIQPSSITVLDTLSEFYQPELITTGDANSARWDGTLTQVYGVVLEMYSTNTTNGDWNIRITDGTKPIMIRIWGSTGIDVSGIEEGKSALWVTGVGGVFNEEYQLLPGYQDQIVIDDNYKPSLKLVKLELPPRPFVPSMGEKLKIRVHAGAPATHIVLTIFDLAGREVITLQDATVEEVIFITEWDGRDTYNNLVPFGTYICQLEILDPTSGSRKFKRAPIVVGTMLK